MFHNDEPTEYDDLVALSLERNVTHMKTRFTLALAAALVIGAIALPVRAALIGETDLDNLTKAMNSQDATVSLSGLSGTTLSDLATAIVTNSGMTAQTGSIYFANSGGFFKQTVGSTTPTTIKPGAKLKLVAARGNMLVVSNASGGSFLYNAAKGTTKYFKPRLKEIQSASLSLDEKHLALIAKNANGKQRLFIAQGSRQNLLELALPPDAKSCSVISLSPNGKTIYVGCTFKNKKFGYTVGTIGNGAITPGTRKIDNNQLLEATWLTNSKLVIMTQSSAANVSIKEVIVSKGKVLNAKVIGSSFLVDANTVAVPMSILRSSTDSILYNLIMAAASDGTPVGSALGSYNTKTSVDQLLYNGTRFLFLMEATL